MKPASGAFSRKTRSPFTLQTKLALAFVGVSLIGFVVAFLLLPVLYLRAEERAIEASKPEIADLLILSFRYPLETEAGKALKQEVEEAAERIESVTGLRFSRLGLPESFDIGFLDATLLARVRENRDLEEEDLIRLRETLFPLDRKFLIVRFYLTPDLVRSDRIWLWVFDQTDQGRRYLIPIMVPLHSPEGETEAILVVAGPRQESLEIDVESDEDRKDLLQYLETFGTRRLDQLLFISSEMENLARTKELFIKDPSTRYWTPPKRSGENEAPRVYVPVYNLAAENRFHPYGFLCAIYEPRLWLLPWQELASSREVYIALFIAALFAIAFSIVFAKGITHPVQELTRGALAIAEGDLDQTMKVETHDEIGVLARTFNEMTARLRTTLDELRDRALTIEHQNVELDRRFSELRTLQNYTERILSTVDSAIFSVDGQGKVHRPNRAAKDMLGVQDGQTLEDLNSESLRESLTAAKERGEATLSDEITVTSVAGEEIPAALSVSPLREGEKITGAVAVLTDLRIIKDLEALVRRQERLAALGQLTAGVAHEIRNPLSIIKACAEILQQRFRDDPGESGLCQDILEEVERLSRVVNDFLSFARPTEPRREPLNLNELIEQTLERVERSFEQDIRIARRLCDPPPVVEADSDQIEQVLLNLLRNSAEAMERGGVITIRTGIDEEAETAWFEVADEGTGMDEETRRRLFDPFYTSKAKGTGLGLSICHRIMDSHAGSIEVVDTAPDKGTVFRVTFQRVPEETLSSLHGKAS